MRLSKNIVAPAYAAASIDHAVIPAVNNRQGDPKYRATGIVITSPNAPKHTRFRSAAIESNCGMRVAAISEANITPTSNTPANIPVWITGL
jgi:hypothetical protein